jgi:hypothetical protein
MHCHALHKLNPLLLLLLSLRLLLALLLALQLLLLCPRRKPHPRAQHNCHREHHLQQRIVAPDAAPGACGEGQEGLGLAAACGRV